MGRKHRRARALVTLGASLVFGATLGAQGDPSSRPDEAAAIEDQMVVYGKALEEIRLRIELAENDVYARFNEINSNDRFDVHCYERPQAGSRIQARRCLSNAWREADIAFADATVRDMQSAASGVANADAAIPAAPGIAAGYSHIPQQYRAKQLRTEELVVAEMRRLAEQDPILQAAMTRLGQAYQALEAVAGSKPAWTLYREVPAGDEGLPFGAQRVVEVRIGDAPWTHALTGRTFTIGSVDGRVRSMRVECDENSARLEYEVDRDWTIPQSWGSCRLRVSAKQGTTFALYEFE